MDLAYARLRILHRRGILRKREVKRMIYLLEDDDSIRKLVIYALESQGIEALGFETPGRFWKAMATAGRKA